MAEKEAQVVEVDISQLDFPDEMSLRSAAIFLEISEMRVRTLAKEEGVPSYKNEAGHWRFSKEDLTEFKATMGTRRGGYRRGDRKYWKIQVKHDDLEEVTAYLQDKFGIEVESAYQYEKKGEEKEEVKEEKSGGIFSGSGS